MEAAVLGPRLASGTGTGQGPLPGVFSGWPPGPASTLFVLLEGEAGGGCHHAFYQPSCCLRCSFFLPRLIEVKLTQNSGFRAPFATPGDCRPVNEHRRQRSPARGPGQFLGRLPPRPDRQAALPQASSVSCPVLGVQVAPCCVPGVPLLLVTAGRRLRSARVDRFPFLPRAGRSV